MRTLLVTLTIAGLLAGASAAQAQLYPGWGAQQNGWVTQNPSLRQFSQPTRPPEPQSWTGNSNGNSTIWNSDRGNTVVCSRNGSAVICQ